MLLFPHPRQSPNSSVFGDPSSFFPTSTPSTQSPLGTSSPQSTPTDFGSRTDTGTDTSTPTTTHVTSSFTPFTPTPTSSFSTFSTFSSSSLSTFSSVSSTQSSPTSTPPHSSSSSTPVSSTPSSSSTLLTSFVTNINGVPTTIVTPVVTALHGASPARVSARPAIIAGSTIGGLVLFFIGLSAIFILRRRVRRQRYWALSRKRLPSRSTFLAGESMDLPPQPTSPYSYADNDDPFATRPNSRHPSGDSPPSSYPYAYTQRPDSPFNVIRTTTPVPSSPPRLFRARASESGSIFQESVWPPPSAASQLTDPLTSASHAVDLGSIVNDVMGPVGPSTTASSESSGNRHGPTREWSGTSETGPLLAAVASAAGDLEPEPEPEPDAAVPTLSLTNPDPGSPLSPLERPHTPPRPPQWLSRSPNPSPKNSPLHRPHPL